jgi:hypothetical protein
VIFGAIPFLPGRAPDSGTLVMASGDFCGGLVLRFCLLAGYIAINVNRY